MAIADGFGATTLGPGAALLPLLLVLPWLALRRRGRPVDLQLAAEMALATYLAVLIGLTFFPLPLPPYGQGGDWLDLNLRPGRTIERALRLGPGSVQFRLLVGNVLAFVPLGLLLPLARPRWHSWARAAGAALALTVAIEIGQLWVSALIGGPYRAADIDDVLVNFAGALAGYSIFRAGRVGAPLWQR